MASETATPAMNEDRDLTLRRLRYRSWHRGCKETDLVLGQFAERHMERLGEAELDVFAALLDEDDVDIWDWLTGKHPPADARYLPLIARLQECGVEK